MNPLTEALYDRLAGDGTLTALLAAYDGRAAIFTIDPAPGDAALPYLVAAGSVVDSAFDTKDRRGRQIWRDVRCYAEADGSARVIETIAERVRALLHRQPLEVEGFGVFLAECSGPVSRDEEDAYGRVVTVRMIMMMEES